MGCLELQTSLSGSLGDRPHATVVQEAAAVEHDGLDSLAQQAFRDRSADSLCPALLLPRVPASNVAFTDGSTLEADTSVRPATSSITCTEMWTKLRKTAILGLSDVPLVR